MTIGQFIKTKREQAGMTQAQLYQFLPTQRKKSNEPNNSTISRIESGTRQLSLEQFVAIARALGHKPSVFLAMWENEK